MFICLFTFFRAVSFPGLAHRRWPSSCRGLCRSRSGRSLRLSPSGRPALHVGAVGFPRLQTACPQLGETPGLFPPPPTMLWPGNSPGSKSRGGRRGTHQPTPLSRIPVLRGLLVSVWNPQFMCFSLVYSCLSWKDKSGPCYFIWDGSKSPIYLFLILILKCHIHAENCTYHTCRAWGSFTNRACLHSQHSVTECGHTRIPAEARAFRALPYCSPQSAWLTERLAVNYTSGLLLWNRCLWGQERH